MKTLSEIKTWQDMKNEVINADCLDAMKLIPDNAIDCIICDLPYGTTACSWDIVIPFDKLWEQYKRIVKDNAAIVLFGSQPFTTDLIMSNRKWFKYCWIWKKAQAVGHLNAYKMPMKNTEDICVFYKNLPKYNYQLIDKKEENIRPATKIRVNNSCYGKHSGESERIIPNNKTLPNQILEFANCQENDHPTQKPLDLIKYLVQTYSDKGDLILDNCLGSGTTMRACKDLGRDCIGIEKELKYCEVADQRLRQQNLF